MNLLRWMDKKISTNNASDDVEERECSIAGCKNTDDDFAIHFRIMLPDCQTEGQWQHKPKE